MSEQKILLVQDASAPFTVLKAALAKGGFQVTTCTSGFDALDEMRSEPSDLVVSSVVLPDISGFQLSSLIKSAEHTCDLPVVVVGNRDELTDTFWKRVSLHDLQFERKDVEFDEEKAVDKLRELIQKNATWKKESMMEHPLMPSDLSGNDLIKSYKELLGSLLMERSVSHMTRSLIEAMGSRVEFMTRYFGYMKRVFGADFIGLIVADAQSPWGIYELSTLISKSAFDKVQTSVNKSLDLVAPPRLITHGEVAEKGGMSLKATEIINVNDSTGKVLGAIVLGWTTKTTLDEPSRVVAELLKAQMVPVFKALFDMQAIQMLKQQQGFSTAVDPITNLYNVEFLIGFLQQQLLFSSRHNLPVGLILIDVDRFLELNQEFGPEVGDMVLTRFAKRLSTIIRSSDLMARYSGDTFAIVLPNTDINGAAILGEKLRSDAEAMEWESIGEKTPKITVSVGCAMFSSDDANPETILRDAKMALISAKQAGRNRVAV